MTKHIAGVAKPLRDIFRCLGATRHDMKCLRVILGKQIDEIFSGAIHLQSICNQSLGDLRTVTIDPSL